MELPAFLNNYSKKKVFITSFVIFVAALFLRLLYLHEIKGTPVLQMLHIDSEYYHNWGVNIANGDILGGNRIFTMAPLYAYFLGLIYTIFGKDHIFALYIQVVIGSLSCILIYLLGLKLFNKKTALLAGIIAALYPIFIFYDAILLKENLMIFFTLLFAIIYPLEVKSVPNSTEYPAVRFFDYKKVLLLVFCGCLIGIHALMRPNILLLVPLLFAYEFFALRKKLSLLTAKFLILGIGIFITVFPVSLRNKFVSGEWVITVASSGMNFWTGNNPEANGAYTGAIFIKSEEPTFEDEDFRKEASRRSGRELNQKEASDFWFREGMRFITSSPKRYFWLLHRKFIGFIHTVELPTDLNYYFAKDFSASLNANIVSFGMIFPFAVLGIFYSIKFLPNNYLLYALILYNLLSSLIFFNTSRYRLPAVPILILFAAYFIIMLFYGKKVVHEKKGKKNERGRSERVIDLKIVLPVLLLLFYVSNKNDRVFSDISSKSLSYVNSAIYYLKLGKLDNAQTMADRAVSIDPNRSLVHKTIYDIQLAKGDKPKAKEALELALRLEEKSAQNIVRPGTIEEAYQLFMQKRYDLALEVFKKLLIENPENKKEFRNNIGLCYLKMGQFSDAEKEFKTVLELDPRYDKALYNYGLFYEVQNDKENASKYYKKVLEVNPSHERARMKISQ